MSFVRDKSEIPYVRAGFQNFNWSVNNLSVNIRAFCKLFCIIIMQCRCVTLPFDKFADPHNLFTSMGIITCSLKKYLVIII
jgi:hypothetical protein